MKLASLAVFLAAASTASARSILQYGYSTSYTYRVNGGNGFYSGVQGVYQTGGGSYSGANPMPGNGGSSGGGQGAGPSGGGSSSGGGGSDDWGVAASGNGNGAAPAPAPSGPPFDIPVQPQIDGYVLGMGLEMKNKWDFPCPRETLSTAAGSDGKGECKLAGSPQDVANLCSSHKVCSGFVYFPNGQPGISSSPVAWMKGGTSPKDGPFDPSKVDLNPDAAIYVKKSAVLAAQNGTSGGGSSSGSGSNGSNSGSGAGGGQTGGGSSFGGSGSGGGSNGGGSSGGSSSGGGSSGGGDNWGSNGQ